MVPNKPVVQFAAESTTRVELAALTNGGLSSETRCAYLSNAVTPASNDLKRRQMSSRELVSQAYCMAPSGSKSSIPRLYVKFLRKTRLSSLYFLARFSFLTADLHLAPALLVGHLAPCRCNYRPSVHKLSGNGGSHVRRVPDGMQFSGTSRDINRVHYLSYGARGGWGDILCDRNIRCILCPFSQQAFGQSNIRNMIGRKDCALS